MSRAYYRKRSEATEQERVINWARFYAKDFPELDLLHHIPNGGSRNQLEAANLKRQGVKAGVPDLCLPVARNGKHGLYVEMKWQKTRPQRSRTGGWNSYGSRGMKRRFVGQRKKQWTQ